MFQSIFGFLVILGPLVVVHEFGHYFFAKIFGVKAEIFSIGFGPRLWSRQIGETEWRVSAIPLGGYVKLLGEEPEQELSPELLKRSLQRQKTWKRFFIFFGGPLFNFIFAAVVFMAIMVIGEQQVASVIGRVLPNSAAEKAGLISGDKVTSVNGKQVRRFDEMVSAIGEHPGAPVKLDLERGKEPQVELKSFTVTPEAREGYSVYGEKTDVGDIDGILPAARLPQVGISNPNSLAGKAGLKTGDSIAEFNSIPIENWEQVDFAYSQTAVGSEVRIKSVSRADSSDHWVVFKKPDSGSLGDVSGVFSSELFIEKAVAKSPAESAGLRTGDRLVGIGQGDIHSFFELRDSVQKSGQETGKVLVRWEREGEQLQAELTPTTTVNRDPELKKQTQFTIGVVPMLVWAQPPFVVERTLNPFTLFYKGTERMVVFSWRNLVSVGKMFTGDVSVGTLGGPILIGKIAGESLSKGLIAFLTTMAILSIGLGVLNVLPVPVLDGGHLMLLGLEAIRGKPLTIRQMEVVQQVGLSLILILMAVVMRNDFTRLF